MKNRVGLLLSFVLFAVAVVACRPAWAQCPLKSGDRVVFYGDSITEQRIYTRYVMNYFTLRYPDLDIKFRNAGWSGDTAPGGLHRLHRDVLFFKPTVVTICFGMNDGGYSGFNQERYDRFMQGMTGLVAELKKANVRVVLLGPGCVDGDQQARLKECNYNDTLSRFSKGVKELADKEKVTYLSLYDIMIDVQQKAKAKDPKYTMIADSVHPNEPGQLVMAYALLKALGCKDQASDLEIDAVNSKSTADRCKVAELKVADGSVTFTRTDEALPMAYDPSANSILDFIRFTQDFNQYNFKVAGLKAGKWKLAVEETEVGTFTEKDLAAGVNLATLPGPWQTLGQKANEASRTQENDYFFAWRGTTMTTNVVPPKAMEKELGQIREAMETLKKKAMALTEEDEAARLKVVPKERAWKWSLTLQQ